MLTRRHFSIDGEHITIFGLEGKPTAKGWAVSVSITGDPHYILQTFMPKPALEEVLVFLKEDIAAGNYAQIATIAMSNRVAVRLWLGKTLRHNHFENVREGEVDDIPFLLLPSVAFEEHTFPILIVPEQRVGPRSVCTLDVNNRIVGDGQQYPIAVPSTEAIDTEFTVEEAKKRNR